MEKHLLSKSTFIRGYQCLKSLYLYKKRYFLRDPLSDEQRLKFKRGHHVGEIAQQLFPGGMDVRPKSPSQYRKAVMKTRELINEGAQVLYEAGFQYDRVLVFLDVLFKREDKWYGCEVKSSRNISDTYLLDAALQYHVITSSGVNIDKFYIAHINEDYVLEDELDINSLFMLVDVSEKILTRQTYIKEQIEREKATLELTSSPKIDVGPHCHDPYPCDFIGHCWKNAEKEVVSIENESSEIRKVAKAAGSKPAYLHLSSFRPAIPIYKGTRPYQEIPFQYSLMDIEGNMQSYLLPPGEHPDLLFKHLRGVLKGFDVIVTDARCKMQDSRYKRQEARGKMQDAGWHGNVIQLRDYFAELSLSELAEGIIEDNTLKSLKISKEILVADAYKNMVHGHEDPLLIQAIKEYGELSVNILKKIVEI